MARNGSVPVQQVQGSQFKHQCGQNNNNKKKKPKKENPNITGIIGMLPHKTKSQFS
jgi:hypothetical protein